jgi:hypothetical protein
MSDRAPLPVRSQQLQPVAFERLGTVAYRLPSAGRVEVLFDGPVELVALVPAAEFRRLQRVDRAASRDASAAQPHT